MLVSNTTKPIHELNVDIVTAFNHYFEILPANTTALKQEVYKLRHQVYCIEKGFLLPRDNGLEYDEYDQYSTHYLIKYIKTGQYIATTRLILPNKNKPNTLFPIEEYSQIDDIAILKTINRQHLAELSRFCISKEFRRRANEQELLITGETRKKQDSPNITLGLFACAMRISVEHDIHYWYALMEPSLQRVVASLGVNFSQLGNPTVSEHYYGKRAPYFIKLTDMLNYTFQNNIGSWHLITNHGQYTIKT